MSLLKVLFANDVQCESAGIWNMYERTPYEVGNVLPMNSLRARVGAESSFLSPCQHFGQGSRFCHIGWCCHGDEARLADSRLYLAANKKTLRTTSILLSTKRKGPGNTGDPSFGADISM